MSAAPSTSLGRLGVLGRPRRHAWWLFPLLAYAATRTYDLILFVSLGKSQIALDSTVDGYHLVRPLGADPGFWALTTNWDGQWFQDIAENGYPSSLPTAADGSIMQNSWAFYPLYPLTVRALMTVLHLPFSVVAPIWSTVLGGAAVLLLYRMLLKTGGPATARATVASFCCFAAAPMLQVAYPDSMTLLLVICSLWFVQERRYCAASIPIILVALTRPVVLPLGVALFVMAALALRRPAVLAGRNDAKRLGALAAWACACTLIWPITAFVVTGSPTAYFDTMKGWGGYTNMTLGTAWLKVLADSPVPLVGVFALIGLVAGCIAIAVRRGSRVWGHPLRIWTAVYALYLIVATSRPAISTLRHLLLVPTVAWPLPGWSSSTTRATSWRRLAILTLCCAIGLYLQYLWIGQLFTIHASPGRQPGPP